MPNNFSQFKTDLTDTQEWLRKEYSQISTGRANPALLDSIMVESYGSQQPVKALASITMEDARTLRIAPWDKDSFILIQKSIQDSGLPFSVAIDDQGLRANIPQLTEENKLSLVKLLKDKLEQARVTVRNHRQALDKEIEGGEGTDDEKKHDQEEMQKLVQETNKTLETIFQEKEKDIMTI